MAAGKFFESELTFYHKEYSYIHIRSQFFVDDTNWFKSGRMLLIVFKNESRGEMISRPGAHEGWEKELLNEIRRVSHSLQSLHKQEPEHSFAPDIDLSDYRLTGREREVLALMLERKTTKEIAFDLGLAEITIRKHLTSLYRKFGVFRREELLLLLFGKNVE